MGAESDPKSFEKRVTQLLGDHEAREHARAARVAHEMDESMEQHRRFETAAADLIHSVIMPRLEFLHCRLAQSKPPLHSRPREALFEVPSSRSRPSTAKVTVRFVPEHAFMSANVSVDVLIVPSLTKYERRYELEIAADRLDADAIQSFLDDALIGFVNDYLRVVSPDGRTADHERAVDPVCGMFVNSRETPFTTRYRKKSYYFCVKHCLEAFERDPERYVHRTRADIDRGERYS